MTRSKVESNTWEMMTQFAMDRQYAGKNDSGSASIPAKIEVTPCSSVIAEVNASCGWLSSHLEKFRFSVGRLKEQHEPRYEANF